MDQKRAIEGLLGASGNPLLQAGMGLLASRYDPSVNPWVQTMQNLTAAKKAQDTEQDRIRNQKMREELSQFLRGQQQMPGQQPPMGAMSPTASPLAPMFGAPTGMAGQMLQARQGGSMAGDMMHNMAMTPQMTPMTQQQRFQGMHPKFQQYIRERALRNILEK